MLGDWKKSDMEVRNNGTDFAITKDPEKNLEKDLAYLDLHQFILIVLEAFKSDAGAYPPYFDEYQVDVMQISDPFEDSDKWMRLLKFIGAHFALKAPLARSAFFCNVFRVADSLREGKHLICCFRERRGLNIYGEISYNSTSASGMVLNDGVCALIMLMDFSNLAG